MARRGDGVDRRVPGRARTTGDGSDRGSARVVSLVCASHLDRRGRGVLQGDLGSPVVRRRGASDARPLAAVPHERAAAAGNRNEPSVDAPRRPRTGARLGRAGRSARGGAAAVRGHASRVDPSPRRATRYRLHRPAPGMACEPGGRAHRRRCGRRCPRRTQRSRGCAHSGRTFVRSASASPTAPCRMGSCTATST